jgi:hypothetical protein
MREQDFHHQQLSLHQSDAAATAAASPLFGRIHQQLASAVSA